jgi:Ca-activated chloride channel family protein
MIAIRKAGLAAVAGTILLLAGCGQGGGPFSGSTGPTIDIISGSENKALEPIVQRFGEQQGFDVRMHYKGSVDIMLELGQGDQMPYDVVWPANSLWITLGDTHKVVKHEESVMHSPVVFGVRRSLAERLGWLDGDVTIADLLAAADAGKFTFAMTSATQSNSGASAYLGFLHALAGGPDVLTHEHLADEAVQDKTRRLLKKIDRSSGSSGWLKELVVEKPDQFQAMVNYESMIIEANRELLAQGKEPLVVIYPTDGMMISDSPLGYVDHGHPEKEQFFRELLAYLKSEPIQREIMGHGRRTGLVGFDRSAIDEQVFNPAWGIDVTRVISPVPTPAEPVIREALDLYQSGGLRKPSATVYVLDCSGSMQGDGIRQLKEAMGLLLDPAQARRYLLQPSARDVHIVVPFDGQPRGVLTGQGNDPSELQRLLQQVQGQPARGGTDMYAGLVRGLQDLSRVESLDSYFPAIILMTDGKSEGRIRDLEAEIRRNPSGPDIPVYSITFGEADERQLKQVSDLTGGRVFDGQKDLATAFRKAKGYN